jgi:hypothetical protein
MQILLKPKVVRRPQFPGVWRLFLEKSQHLIVDGENLQKSLSRQGSPDFSSLK